MGLPFMPVRGIVGTDYTAIRQDFKVIQNPYGEDQVALVPPLRPSIALIHTFAADRAGNVLVDSFENDPLLARASRQVYASTEQIVPAGALKSMAGTLIPAPYIKGVILQPEGARPTGCRGFYPPMEESLHAFLQAAREKDSFRTYVDHLLEEGGDQLWKQKHTP
jgi:glutaconate CoA-transferase, subunit A